MRAVLMSVVLAGCCEGVPSEKQLAGTWSWGEGATTYELDGMRYHWVDDTLDTGSGEWDIDDDLLVEWPNADAFQGLKRCSRIVRSTCDDHERLQIGRAEVVQDGEDCPDRRELGEPMGEYTRVE